MVCIAHGSFVGVDPAFFRLFSVRKPFGIRHRKEQTETEHIPNGNRTETERANVFRTKSKRIPNGKQTETERRDRLNLDILPSD